MRRNWWIVLWVLAAVGAIAGLVLYTQRDGSDISITSDYMDGSRISTVGMFTVGGASAMDADELAGRLVFEPEVEFQLRKKPDGTFTLLTYRPLEPGTRIQITLLGSGGGVQKTWEFQTSDTFQVTGVFPADGATDVPPSSSIEVQFSFSDLEDDYTFDQYISLSPEMEFYYGINNHNLVIYPADAYFPAGTDITVTISGDLPRKSGGTLGQDITFTFTTGPEEDRDYSLSSIEARVTENILPGDAALLKLSMGNEMQSIDLTTTVYRFADGDAYVDAMGSYRDAAIQREYTGGYSRSIHDYWQVDTQGLEQVMQFTGPSVQASGWSYERYVLLPDELEPGWYAAVVEATMPSGGKIQASKLIQVSPLSVFTIQPSRVDRENGSTMLAWINNTETGAPAAGATVKVSASNFQAEGTAGEDGVAMVSGAVTFLNREGQTLEEGQYLSDQALGLLEVRHGDQVFHEIYGQSNSFFQQRQKSNDYTGYLFTDRPVYRHIDTVKAWGLVQPWKEETPPPAGQMYLSTSGEAFRQPIQLREDGTFLTEFQLEAVSGSGMWMQIEDEDGVVYGDLWVRLEDYVKPEYQTSSTLDFPVFTAWLDHGEGVGAVGMDFTAHYYEGSPAQRYEAEAREPENAYNAVHFPEVEVATDADGYARVVLQPGEIDSYYEDHWQPHQLTYGIYSTGELGAPQVEGGTFYYLTRDLMLELEEGTDGASVTARVHHIDISGIESEADLLVTDNLRGAPAGGVELTAEIHKEWYERIPDGERYDAINKTSTSAFRYEYMDDVVESRSGVTADGVYTFTGLPTAGEEGESYYVIVSLGDTRGEPVAERITYTDGLSYGDYEAPRRFRLVNREEEGAPTAYVDDYYGQYFDDGETLDLYLSEDNQEFADPDGSLLYVVAQDGLLDHGVGAATTLQLPFSEDYLPNYSLAGAYFDGKRVYALSTSVMVFDPAARELEIEILPEQERYSPGDTAAVSLKVTEKESGAAVADANLVAAVVDEAVFAIEEQEPDFLAKYYRETSFSYLIKYTSYDNQEVDGGGRGGGGPDPFLPRVDFPDTAAFVELTTGSDGVATFTVDLPDNLTSWRVTALAMSAGRKMGDNKGNFTVGKDFFVSPVLPPRLLTGDDLVITVHSAGMAVSPDDAVSYTCSIEGLDGEYTASGRAGDYTPIPFDQLPQGGLPEGEYRLTVTGRWNDTGDTVILPLSVTDSGVTLTVTERMSLSDAAVLDSKAWPVTLGFYDKDSELGVEILSYLYSQDGNRLDQKMARRYALEQMSASGMDLRGVDTSGLFSDFREYYPDYQGYRLFPYSAPDQVLSTRVKLMAEQYSGGGTVYGFEELPDDPTERAACYLYFCDWEPGPERASEIDGMLADDLYSFRDKMFLVAALGVMGFEEGAATWYEQLSQPLRTEQADANGNALVSMGGNSADTAAASMVANLLGLPDSEGMARYLLTTPDGDDIYLLELMYYLQQNHGEGQPGGSLSYTRDGETMESSLQNGFVYQVFTKDQLAEANFQTGDNIWVSAVYTAGLEQALGRDNGTLALSKTVEPVEGDTLRKGDLAKITLRLDIPTGVTMDQYARLEIQDYVPTGMRYESMEGETGWGLSRRDDQRVAFDAYRDKAGTLVYYARCVAPGSYVVESAFGGTASGSAWGATERDVIVIQP